jgi:XTP/dITP diphosphohydrolase
VWVRHAAEHSPLIAHGSWEGRIAHVPRGHGGFGYDPVFIPDRETRSAAELPAAEKNAVSHRGQALRALVAMLESAGYIRTP